MASRAVLGGALAGVSARGKGRLRAVGLAEGEACLPDDPSPDAAHTRGPLPDAPLPADAQVDAPADMPEDSLAAPTRPLHPDQHAAPLTMVEEVHAVLHGYQPVEPGRVRPGGWTAVRQRKFLVALAETGSVSEASVQAGISARSAYRLRQRTDAAAFADAWDHALKLATMRLMTLAFERATTGTVREIWREGRLIGTTRAPSEKLLMFLIRHLLPAPSAAQSPDLFQAEIEAARAHFPAALEGLCDNDVDMVEIQSRDFFPTPPGDPREDW